MALSSLASLGKVAGLAGLAIGLVVLLIRPTIARISSVPKTERAGTLRLVAIGSFGIGALGIGAWLVSALSNVNVTANGGSMAAGGNISGNTVTLAPPRSDVDPSDPSTWARSPRNAPCPCGSGKKFKHCHGRTM